MKYTLAFAALAIAVIGIASCSNEKTYTDMSQIPESVQNTIVDNFNANVVSTQVETNTFGVDEYEIYLADGSKVKFEGEVWDEVEVPVGQSVPNYFVIEPIRNYVAQNMPGVAIIKIEKEKNGYEVELSTGMDVKFDANGTVIKID